MGGVKWKILRLNLDTKQIKDPIKIKIAYSILGRWLKVRCRSRSCVARTPFCRPLPLTSFRHCGMISGHHYATSRRTATATLRRHFFNAISGSAVRASILFLCWCGTPSSSVWVRILIFWISTF